MVTDIDTALSALADPTRRQVVDLLRERPRRAGELAAACQMSGPAMSKHLRVLRASGLVDEQRVEQDARVHVYQLRPEPFLALRAWLDHVQMFWTDQLSAFKEHVEQTRGEQTGRAEPAQDEDANGHGHPKKEGYS
jgi:DNA-binding transcriptional ArsR family regulator